MEDPSWGRVTQKQKPAGWSRFQGRSQRGPQIQEQDTGVCVVTWAGDRDTVQQATASSDVQEDSIIY